MSKIFICYRRDDAGASCGHIYERLSNHFGPDAIFKDVDNIPPGARFSDVIAKQLTGCRVELVAIGRSWLNATTTDGIRRLDAPNDYVRAEIEFGLRAGLIVVPLLVDHATMPQANQLPSSIRELVELQNAVVRNDPDFNPDMQRLIRQLERWLGVMPSFHGYPTPPPTHQTIKAIVGRSPDLGSTVSIFKTPDGADLEARIEKLLVEISAVGDGDLSVQAEVTPDTLGVLADSFNFMIEELAKVVGRVQATTNQVSGAARRMLDRSASVTQAAEAQARQISLVSEHVTRLANFMQLSATNALQATAAASEALQSSHDSQASMVKTIDSMAHIRDNMQETTKKIRQIGERSHEVGELASMIEDMAEQTSLLALNAVIQSAMAGEHGRGFHAVADEIRILAERILEATKRTGVIVKTIQGNTYEAVIAMEEGTQEVIKGSQLAGGVGRTLQRIYSAVDQQAQTIHNITDGANERRQVAETVVATMGKIAEVTFQTNLSTQDSMTAVTYLAELAEQLRASVAAYRLPDELE